MEIEYFGGNAIRLKVGTTSIGFDLSLPGQDKFVGASKELRAAFYTDSSKVKGTLPDGVMKFEMAGEYEIGPFSVQGVATKSYGDVYGTSSSNVYLADGGEFGLIGVVGYVNKELDEKAGELLANARLLFVPVGGTGLGLEPEEALKIVKELNAEFVVPIHFDDGKTKYDSPQAKVDEFIKLTGVEPDVFEGKVNTKSLGPAIDGFKVVVIKP
ncbi:MAG: MBL fold metallo-hydrolase [Candidatus Nomurabacteria bacterium]|nr:MAG: MBL fold metallo-hydrolase [Candidatus Nomurabacteria bacterium]